MSHKTWKWIYTFVMLAVTIGWAAFTVIIVRDIALKVNAGTIEQIDVIAAAGAGTVTGALITWNSVIINHWFRKKIDENVS